MLRLILLFDWDHPSVPTCTRCLPSRTAEVKDEPLFAATARAARSVLDGREHGGMLERSGLAFVSFHLFLRWLSSVPGLSWEPVPREVIVQAKETARTSKTEQFLPRGVSQVVLLPNHTLLTALRCIML